jgi:hypothetical protein
MEDAERELCVARRRIHHAKPCGYFDMLSCSPSGVDADTGCKKSRTQKFYNVIDPNI